MWLHARDRYDGSLAAARAKYESRIEWGRREELAFARAEYDATLVKLGQPPLLSRVIDPDIVCRIQGRYCHSRTVDRKMNYVMCHSSEFLA